MAKPAEKLATSLDALHALQQAGKVAIRSGDLPRTHLDRLIKSGFLHEVMKGWYIPGRADDGAGETTAWYASYWDFAAAYLRQRFAEDWVLSPEQSLLLHAGNRTVPKQLVVRTPKARNKVTQLMHGTSLLDIRALMPQPADIKVQGALRVYDLPAALVAATAAFFQAHPTDARALLATVPDASDVLRHLLNGGHAVVAGRLAGAFRNIGRARVADDIVKTMQAAHHDTRETDPFAARAPILLSERQPSPYVNRIQLMWHNMRAPILEIFPKPPGPPNNIDAYLERVQENYVTDAYHSLSIEGYRVSRELIERVRRGDWNPDGDDGDRDQRNAMAARGYYLAYQAVRQSLTRILSNEASAGAIIEDDHAGWYRQLFSPSVETGLVKPADLAGYRNDQVYIRRSMHVPPPRDAVRDLMPAFFELLRNEPEPAVRAVLGHFVFVYIHPYMDGNGRMSRFLMNAALASGGYPWTVIPVESRTPYLVALEAASAGQDIAPFATFLAELVTGTLAGNPAAQAPQ